MGPEAHGAHAGVVPPRAQHQEACLDVRRHPYGTAFPALIGEPSTGGGDAHVVRMRGVGGPVNVAPARIRVLAPLRTSDD